VNAEHPSSSASAPQEDGRSAREHVLEAFRLLDKGDPKGARSELTLALHEEPGNETAASLFEQLDADPEEMLGKESFPYTVQGGDTLSKIAKRFLNDDRKFYILARYNDIEVPGDLAAGQVLKIPGKKPASPVKPAPPAPKEPAAVAPKPVPPAKVSPNEAPPAKIGAETEPNSEKLYQSGLKALSGGAPDKAYDLFSQALKANPKHTGAQDKMREIKSAAVEAYYRKALAAYRRQDLDGTINYCNKALEIDPDSEKVKLRRAEALELQTRMKNFK
jgi:tetratricopeptide (TPR) repeat protein